MSPSAMLLVCLQTLILKREENAVKKEGENKKSEKQNKVKIKVRQAEGGPPRQSRNSLKTMENPCWNRFMLKNWSP